MVPVAAEGETMAVSVMLVPTVKLVDEAVTAVVVAVPLELELEPEPPQPVTATVMTAISNAAAEFDKKYLTVRPEQREPVRATRVRVFIAFTNDVSVLLTGGSGL